MHRRHELSDAEWDQVSRHFAPARTGRPPRDYRARVNAILWVLRTGAPWRDLPEHYGPWKTAYSSFSRWTTSGRWAAVTDDLLLQQGHAGKIDHSLWCVDGSVSRAHRVAAGARHTGGSQ